MGSESLNGNFMKVWVFCGVFLWEVNFNYNYLENDFLGMFVGEYID